MMSKTNISFLVLVIPVCRQAGWYCILEIIWDLWLGICPSERIYPGG